jgi:hypothetical protein
MIIIGGIFGQNGNRPAGELLDAAAGHEHFFNSYIIIDTIQSISKGSVRGRIKPNIYYG